MTVEALRAQLKPAEPVFTEGMTRAEIQAEWDRHGADFKARNDRLDEEHLLLGIGRSAAVCMTHELIFQWQTATSDRWFRALPERYMTPDSMTRPDWDHRHYEHGHIGRVRTLQRPKTQADTEAEQLVSAILAGLQAEREQEKADES